MAFQHRFDGSVSFTRNWEEYKEGFGDGEGEYWLGNELLHQLVTSEPYDLLVIAKDFEGGTQTKKFNHLTIAPEADGYRFNYDSIYTSGYSLHQLFNSMKGDVFQTPELGDCGAEYASGWWFRACHMDNMNGEYVNSDSQCRNTLGIHWFAWKTFNKCLKETLLMIKPKSEG